MLTHQARLAGGAAAKAVHDLSGLAGSVQKLCQVAVPLARSLECLQDDLAAMTKEHRCVCSQGARAAVTRQHRR